MKFLKRARNLLREHIVVLQSSLNPVVALNSALRFIKPLPREGWLSNQCRHLDQSKSDLWKLSSKR